MSALLDKRLVVVTGKGGVGKTTVAAALGLLAARRGRRTILCEVSGQARLAALFDGDAPQGTERPIAPGLAAISVDPRRARREYLERQLRSGTVAGILDQSRIFQLLAAAAPGLAELLTIGKIWDLAQLERRTRGASYDLVIVDAPSSGHGLALLQAPRTYAGIAKVGPIHRQALHIDRFLHDRALTAVVAVALPEEMPVSETLELEARLGEDELGLDAVVLNGLHPERFSAEDARRIAALDGRVPPRLWAALGQALSEHRRARGQRSQLRRLRRGLDAPVTTLPFLFEPELRARDVEELSRRLERSW
jgi:anion-transporting  ArsA/GET3 family ATPase